MIYFVISYLSIGVGFALGMMAESLARDGRIFDGRADLLLMPVGIVAWLPFVILGTIIEYRTARRLNRPFFMK